MAVPNPTPIYRFIHVDNLHIYLRRGGIHAPNHMPDDGLIYRTNHDVEVQAKRHVSQILCGPKGVVHDYVPFYFGYLSPMMLQLKTGQVSGYNGGQEALVYLVSTAQAVQASEAGFVFSDGHGIAAFTKWFDDLADLEKLIGTWCMSGIGQTRSTTWTVNGASRPSSSCIVSATGR